jgi:hypothetical protein
MRQETGRLPVAAAPDSKVVRLDDHRRGGLVWQCSCRGQTFALRYGGEIECLSCGDIQPTRHWSTDPS